MPSEAAAASRSGGLDIELTRVSLERGGKLILRDLDWSIGAGERWVLLGSNGAGKTQLLKLVAGDVWPTPTGRERVEYRWQGERSTTPMGVKDEIAYLGAERQDRYARYEWNHTVTAVVGTGLHREEFPLAPLTQHERRLIGLRLRQLHLAGFGRRRFLTLSYGERRLVLLARALAWNPELLLLDELMNGLDETRRREVLGWLEGTRGARRGWVLATHRLDDVPRSATHLLILQEGRAAYAGPLRREPLERWFRARAVPIRRAGSNRQTNSQREEVLVELTDAQVWLEGKRILEHVSFAVRPQECWVVHGGNGVGKSTLLRTLYGDHAVALGGQITRQGIVPGVPLEVFKRWVGLVAPHLQADHPLHLSVAEVVQTGRHASIGLNARATRTDRAAARVAMRRFGIEPLAAATLREISYGQFRRVLFARAWVNRPRLLLLDEPFEGLDPQTRTALIDAVDALIAEGVAVVMATHHRGEWPAAASHEIELAAGGVRYVGRIRGAGAAPTARGRARSACA